MKIDINKIQEETNYISDIVNETKEGAFLILATDEDNQLNRYAGSHSVIGSMLMTFMTQDEEFAETMVNVVMLYAEYMKAMTHLDQTRN